LSEIFLILRRIQRYAIINVQLSSHKVPLSSTEFRKVSKYQISVKPSYSLQTDRHDKANSRFSQFCECS